MISNRKDVNNEVVDLFNYYNFDIKFILFELF
jgi:hypothetical protein